MASRANEEGADEKAPEDEGADEWQPVESLVDSLQRSHRLPSASDLDDEALVDSPGYKRSPDDVSAEMRRIRRELDAAPDESQLDGGLTRQERAQRVSRLGILNQILGESIERDRRKSERNRPAGCWCLGLGGRGRIMRASGSREVDEATGQLKMSVDWMRVDAESQRALMRAEEYCGCPEGRERRELEAARAASWVAGRRFGQAEKTLESLWRETGMTPMTRYDSLAAYPRNSKERKDTASRISAWLGTKHQPVRGLYLCGPPQRAKTTLMRSIAREILERGLAHDRPISVKFFSAPKLVDYFQAGVRGIGLSTEERIAELAQVDYLFIDDLGTQAPRAWSLMCLAQLVDDRDLARKCTVYTSNFVVGSDPNAGLPPTDGWERKHTLIEALLGRNPEGDAENNAIRIEARIRRLSNIVWVMGDPLGAGDQLPEREW